MTRRHAANLALGIAVTAACLAAALWGFDRDDYAEIASSFRRADYRTLPLVLALLVGFFWLKAVRWALLLRPLRPAAPLTAAQSVPALMIGFAGNNLLPAHLGEFLRVYVLGRQYGLPKAAIFSTVVLERVCDVAAILAFLGGGLAFAPEAPPEARTTGYVLAVMLAAGLAGIVVYALWTAWFVRTVERLLAKLPLVPAGLKRKAAELLEAGALGMAALRSGRLAFWIAVTSLAQWLLMVGMIDLALVAFDISRPAAVAAVVMGVVAFGVTVPSTPGFFGVIQVAFRVALAPFGVAATDAVAASVYFHLTQWVAITAVGLFFLQRAGLKLGQLEQAAEETEVATERELPAAG
ncbi:MAG TPA: lysylphosphatidylglycerol synthase transmembrane domain-containing protein [Planctomycetaceae bacterium]